MASGMPPFRHVFLPRTGFVRPIPGGTRSHHRRVIIGHSACHHIEHIRSGRYHKDFVRHHRSCFDHTAAPLSTRVSTTLQVATLALALAVLIFLAVLSILSTGYFNPVDDPKLGRVFREGMTLHHGLPSMWFILGVIILSAVVIVIARLWTSIIPKTRLGLFTGIYTLSMAVLWITALNITGKVYDYSDSTSLINAANALVEGKVAEFVPQPDSLLSTYSYFSWYPFQTGAMLWFALVFKLFGTGNLFAFQIINAIMLGGIGYMLQRIGAALGLSEQGQRMETLLIMTSMPFVTSAAFIYPNTAGLFFVMLSLMAALRAVRQRSSLACMAWIVLCFVIGAVAVMIKGTVILFVIAYALVLGICAIRDRRYWMVPVTFALLYAANKASVIPLLIVEHAVGQHFGPGLPQSSWIAIGLTQNSTYTTMPGWWYNEAIQVYRRTGGDTVLMQQAANATIAAALHGFAANPLSAVSFVVNKLASEWAEPTYQTLYYSALAERRSNGPIASLLFFGRSNTIALSFANIHQTVVYTFAGVGMATGLHRRWMQQPNDDTTRSDTMLFLAMILLGGFGCFLLWEAKSVYTFPFALMLMPLAADGLAATGDLLFRRCLGFRIHA
ncbi:phospholipid carrier-dependent glycosyltransferase [Bifidobacterium ramosum]|uniref:phospholipid carrier-dependent glycosyltransferase n=1 Tax=Bifidobacterium ramosum TaxID=1798158 RepID=UPI0013D2B573|nr:phospholipid carrier-dependent glycosyltransferase [Bifidobacterium ramosum]